MSPKMYFTRIRYYKVSFLTPCDFTNIRCWFKLMHMGFNYSFFYSMETEILRNFLQH